MRNAQGYSTLFEPGRPVQETDTFTCGHCQCIVTVPPRTDPANLGGLCKLCDKLICPHCYQHQMKGNPCVTWEKRMERAEARDRFLRSAGIT